MFGQPVAYRPGPGIEPSDRYMRHQLARFGRQTRSTAGALDPSGEGCQAFGLLGRRPQRAHAALLRGMPDLVHAQHERLGPHRPKRIGQIIGLRSIDLAHEAQGQVQLLIPL